MLTDKLIQICPIPGNRMLEAVFLKMIDEPISEDAYDEEEMIIPIYHFAVVEIYDTEKKETFQNYQPIVFDFVEGTWWIPHFRGDFFCFQVDGKRIFFEPICDDCEDKMEKEPEDKIEKNSKILKLKRKTKKEDIN